MALHFPTNRASVNVDYYVCDANMISLKHSPKKQIHFQKGITHKKMRTRIKEEKNIEKNL